MSVFQDSAAEKSAAEGAFFRLTDDFTGRKQTLLRVGVYLGKHGPATDDRSSIPDPEWLRNNDNSKSSDHRSR